MRLISAVFIICLMSLTLGNSSAWAQQEVQLVVNELKIFPISGISRVAVGDPTVADVTVLSERELMLVGKKEGVTSLIIWDQAGQRPFNITVIKKDLEKMAQRIRALLISSDIRGIRVKIEGDKLYVIGEAFRKQEMDKVKDILKPFPKVVNLVKIQERQPLVEIDVNVLEVAFDDVKKLGLDWSNSLPITYTETDGNKGDFPKLWKVLDWTRATVEAKLNFLIEEDRARTLANPKLITLSGQEASFLVGGEVPYVTVTAGTSATTTIGATNVEWKEYGVNLKINPQVNPKNEIHAIIKAEVSDLDWANAVTFQGFSIPALKKRVVQTELFLNEGDTIFLAGLIKNDDSRNADRLPWLSRVPILGEMFKSTQFQNERTELVVSITPRIIGEKASPDYLSRDRVKEEVILAAQQAFPAYSEEVAPLAYYTHMIEDIITRNVVYPAQARETQDEGIVKIDIYLLPDGNLREASVRESSGSRVLDDAALIAVRDMAPYPSFPSQINQTELRLTVPVVFKSYAQKE